MKSTARDQPGPSTWVHREPARLRDAVDLVRPQRQSREVVAEDADVAGARLDRMQHAVEVVEAAERGAEPVRTVHVVGRDGQRARDAEIIPAHAGAAGGVADFNRVTAARAERRRTVVRHRAGIVLRGADHDRIAGDRNRAAELIARRRIAGDELLLLSPDAVRVREHVRRAVVREAGGVVQRGTDDDRALDQGLGARGQGSRRGCSDAELPRRPLLAVRTART